MNAEYQKVIILAHSIKIFCNQIGYDWRTEDIKIDDFKERYGNEIRKRLSMRQEFSAQEDVDHISDTFFTVAHWNRYKKIYQFNPAFVYYLSQTEAGALHKDLLQRLPFKSFYISFGGEILTEDHQLALPEGTEPAIGMFVHLYFYNDEDGQSFINYSLCLIGREGSTLNIFCGAKDGVVMQDAVDIDQWPEGLKKFVIGENLNKIDEIRERQKRQKPFFMIALNACQYLCASNAEIRDLKVSKKDKPVVSVNGKKTPVSVQVSNVGYYIGKRFEKMYAESVGDGTRAGVSGTKKRPHVRRAHWHHYWTGPGRTVLQVKWLEPIFVMGEENGIKTAVHIVEGA